MTIPAEPLLLADAARGARGGTVSPKDLLAAAGKPTVVLTLTPEAPADARQAAYDACDRAARASGLTSLGVVVDSDLRGLEATALALPTAYRRSPD